MRPNAVSMLRTALDLLVWQKLPRCWPVVFYSAPAFHLQQNLSGHCSGSRFRPPSQPPVLVSYNNPTAPWLCDISRLMETSHQGVTAKHWGHLALSLCRTQHLTPHITWDDSSLPCHRTPTTQRMSLSVIDITRRTPKSTWSIAMNIIRNTPKRPTWITATQASRYVHLPSFLMPVFILGLCRHASRPLFAYTSFIPTS
jgi:hypothetical protein